jgi:hypothetical protein
MKKNIEYKSFNFPNSLSSFEQYYYYLLEFDVIPKSIHPKLIERIFLAVATDYLEGFLDFNTFCYATENLYGRFVISHVGVDKRMEKIMDEIYEDENLKEKEIKEKLENLFKPQ